ncbi:protein of unknown function [Pseudomonas mediterranea]
MPRAINRLSAIKTYARSRRFYVFKKYVYKTWCYKIKAVFLEKTVHSLSTDIRQQVGL